MPRQHVRRNDPRPIAARRLPQEALVGERSADHLEDDAVPDVRNLLLNCRVEEIGSVLFLREVLIAARVQMGPILPGLSGWRVCMQRVVARGCQRGIQHRWAAHQDGIPRFLEVPPMPEDAPLRWKFSAMRRRQSISAEAQVKMDEGLQLGEVLPGTVEVLLQLGRCASWHELLGNPPVCIAHHSLLCGEDAAVGTTHTGSPTVLHEHLLRCQAQDHAAALPLFDAADHGVHNSDVASSRVVQAGVFPVHVRHHVGHHARRCT
mmetsp:Transcript_9725/g.21768  ORF Transcript_9725/g.21768 Transcript_9725/m.21768 type:complete len:263 (-) Transcript_9725:1023-1811(-)